MGDVMVRGCLGHSDHEMIEFSILREIRMGVRRTALDFQRADFVWLTESLGRQS